MNGSPTSPVSTPKPAESLSREELVAQIDASCRVLLLPIVSALVWLLLSSVLALIASVKLHSPTVLADCSWLTYGHTRPAANDAFVYGFASQAGLAIALWILCRLGRTNLVGAGAIAVGSLFWNLGVTFGLVGIFSSHSTGFDWLEFPSAGSSVFVASYTLFGICGLLTFKTRRAGELFPSQWYILAALFWFPWLYTTARLLLNWFPVRGVMQLVVNGWYANGLFTLWLASLALAVLFYFVPKLTGAPLFSRPLAVIGFWSLAAFGPWAGFYHGLPLPAWMISIGIAATIILLVPLIATVSNLWMTMGGGPANRPPLLGFFKTSVVFFALTGVFAIFAALIPQLRLTLFGEGTEQLVLYGFVGLALLGAIHYIAPRLTGVTSEKFIGANCWATLIGILVYAGAFLLAGIIQHRQLINGSIPFTDVMNATKPFIRISTIGILLLIVGNAAILLRVVSMVCACCKNCCRCDRSENAPVNLKPARAAR